MSWNKSGGAAAVSAKGSGGSRPHRPHRPPRRLLLPVLLALLAAGGIAWWAWQSRGSTPIPERPRRSPAAIPDAGGELPRRSVATPEPEPEPPKPVDPNARPTKVGEMVNGYVMLPSGRIHRRIGAVTNSIAGRPKPHYHIFKHRTDNEIASYLSLLPGDVLVGTRRHTGKFEKQFLESLKDPIVVTPEDTPEQAKLKHDVAAVRQQLKSALDGGADIEQIMIDTRNELQDLMRVKSSMRKLFNEEAAKCRSEQDVDDMLQACNKMLAEKGIAPLKCGFLAKMNILRNDADANDDSPEEQTQSIEGTTR